MAVLTFSNVSVVRGRSRILDGVSWAVDEGERWVILGPNGAGKTTLLELAAARLHPTAGDVELLDEQLGQVDVFELRPRIGWASSLMAEVIPDKESVLDVVLTASYAVVGRWRETYDQMDVARAWDLLTALGVSALSYRGFGTLSEGERKRVQIARALMADPELLLLDEPGAGLDLGGREDLVHRLDVLASDPDSPTLLLVTHHVEEIPPSFTHALLMRNGQVVVAGPLDMVLTSAWLTAAFGLPMVLERRDGRFFARALLPPVR